MLDSVPDVVIGVLFFGGFLIIAVLAGGLIQKGTGARNVRALQPLARILGGEPQGDHKSASLTTHYRGYAAQVKIIPGKNIGQNSDTMIKINYFEITFQDIQGQSDWQISHEGIFRKKWVVASPDGRLRSGLEATDLADRLERLKNCMLLRYDAGKHQLVLEQDLKPRKVPTQAQLDETWELLIRAANINQNLNTL